MIRILFTIIAGVLLGGVVHLVSVLALPRIATQDAYSRLTPMTKLNAVTARAAPIVLSSLSLSLGSGVHALLGRREDGVALVLDVMAARSPRRAESAT